MTFFHWNLAKLSIFNAILNFFLYFDIIFQSMKKFRNLDKREKYSLCTTPNNWLTNFDISLFRIKKQKKKFFEMSHINYCSSNTWITISQETVKKAIWSIFSRTVPYDQRLEIASFHCLFHKMRQKMWKWTNRKFPWMNK